MIEYIYLSCFCIVFERIIMPIFRIITGIRKTVKPFDCAPCLSFWLSLIMCVYLQQNYLIPFYVYIQTILIKKLYDTATV